MTESTKQLTVSISVPAIVHLGVGAVLIAAAAAAFVIHTELPTSSPYSADTLAAGGVLFVGAAAYWLWCSIQRSRNETADVRTIIIEAAAAAKRREEDTIVALGEVSSTLTTIAGEVAENAGRLKELGDGTDETSVRLEALERALEESSKQMMAAVEKATKAVNALQDCYLKEGRLLLFPEPSEEKELRDVDPALGAQQERPGPNRSGPFRRFGEDVLAALKCTSSSICSRSLRALRMYMR